VADLNNLHDYLYAADAWRNQNAMNDLRNRQDLMMAQQQMLMYGTAMGGGVGRWWAQDFAKPDYAISGGEGNAFVARFVCKVTQDCFELSSMEKPAVERGMRHYVERWESAIRHLRDAGMKDDELHIALVVIKPRLVEEAQRERSMEEGLREAENKARSLLVMCLTPAQREEFDREQSFTLTVDHKVSGFPTGAFRIRKGSAFNVEHVESGETFCVVAQEKVPVYDQMLTQKLLLEQEPERFFKTANRSRGRFIMYPGDFATLRPQQYAPILCDPPDEGMIERALRRLGLR
jgi:hypothetical protein